MTAVDVAWQGLDDETRLDVASLDFSDEGGFVATGRQSTETWRVQWDLVVDSRWCTKFETLDAEGVPVPSETLALYGFESAGGVHLNTVPDLGRNGQRDGTITAAGYDRAVARVSEVLLGARNPETGEPVITAVHRADAQAENGLGGPHGADLYLELAPGYYWSSDAEAGPIVEASEPFTTGVHGLPTLGNDALLGYAVLGGDGFTDGVVAERARSTVLTPTAMRAVGLEPPAEATGGVQRGWLND